MYPQNVRTRTLSVATSSTGPSPESSYTGPRGPTHPYGMYPQGTASEPNNVMAAAIPVGFNNVGAQYQRRLGPEGEEMADMIGPDGHTEQLPPYTRYPEEAYSRKASDVENGRVPPLGAGAVVAGISTAAAVGSAASAPSTIPGAGGLGLATRNPEFESTDDLGSPHSRYSTRSFPVSSGSSHHEPESAAAAVTSEKGKALKPWQLWMRRRLWGIVPYWAICLTLAVLALMAIILGTVVGTLLSKHKKPPNIKPESDTAMTTTVTYDATPIPTPTDLPPLATGTFGLPLMSNRVSSTCFNDTQQSQAWSCSIVMSGLYLTVLKDPGSSSPGDYSVNIDCNRSLTIQNNVYSYGEQPPIFPNPKPLPMELVNDTYEPSRGPAWFRMMAYNKTIIIPDNALAPSVFNGQKRGVSNSFRMGPDDFKRKGVAQIGDKPWICTWPDTFLELFIYPVQNSSWNRPPPMPNSGSDGGSTSGPPPTSTSSSGNPHAANTGSPGTNTITTAPTPTGFGGKTYTTSSASAASVSSSVSMFPSDQGGPSPPPPYPRVIKLEERRISGSPPATCVQVEIKDPGRPAVPVKDKDGNDVTITIAETLPPQSSMAMTDLSLDGEEKRSLYNRDAGADLSQCGCIWFLT
ncbi:hypothetical protein GQ53DRAFT_638324 [Thozetella sp. PMI_491]|nr:hypothetical protein GQ53DRAFT_638324 [Thozetella sp. PMI_491]